MSSIRQRSRKLGDDDDDYKDKGYRDPLLLPDSDDNDDPRRFASNSTTTRLWWLIGLSLATVLVAVWLVIETTSIATTTTTTTSGTLLQRRNKRHATIDNGRGGIALDTTTTTAHADRNGYWILKACPSHVHGTTCPDTTDFPLSVQIWNEDDGANGDKVSYLLPPVVWETVDAHDICGGGKTWRIPVPSRVATTVKVELNWYRTACLHGHEIQPWNDTITINIDKPKEDSNMHNAQASSYQHYQPWKKHHQNLFMENAAWHKVSVSTKKDDMSKEKLSAVVPYIWATPEIATASSSAGKLLTTQNASIWQETIVVQPKPGYGKFGDLSNYELLCFVGNQTMLDIRRSFLDLRAQLFNAQRPFKFHFYDLADLQQPDKYWTEEDKKRIRKCKHLLVNMEEFVQPLSQLAYQAQVENFVGHLVRLMNDETFPIRLLTWTESAVGTKHCHSPFLPWSNQHPCNAVLHKLFDPPVFPQRVKLLDNTDLTLPVDVDGGALSTAGRNKNMRAYLLAAIALRIYVITGEQVAAWRALGQIGKIDGLHRNGKVEPNFALEPYLHWGQPL